jgi:hypothetical protein
MDTNSVVTIHGEKWQLSDRAPKLEDCRKRQWRKQRWVKRDALTHRDSGMIVPYLGQAYSTTEFEVVRGGWTKNLCEICFWELCESDSLHHSMGYTDGRRWLCIECHDLMARKH